MTLIIDKADQVGSGGGVWELVSDTTVGSDATSVTFSSLDLGADVCYRLIVFYINAYNGGCEASLYANGNTTATNYYQSYHFGYTSGSGGANGNAGTLSYLGALNDTCVMDMILMQPSGYKPKLVGGFTTQTTTALRVYQKGWQKTDNTTNVTSLTFQVDQANGIKAGSRFVLLKLVT